MKDIDYVKSIVEIARTSTNPEIIQIVEKIDRGEYLTQREAQLLFDTFSAQVDDEV